jgi:hypothetical protein
MISGPKVDIYVGPERKHHSMPRLLLCHYSDYFDRCFNGMFTEAQSQKLTLPEDNVEDFEMILEYMLHGTARPIAMEETGTEGVKRCMEVLEYAGKYNLGGVCEAVHDPLKAALVQQNDPSGWASSRVTIEASQIELVMAQAALSAKGIYFTSDFEKQMQEVEGFALELFRQMVSSWTFLDWVHPLTQYPQYTTWGHN